MPGCAIPRIAATVMLSSARPKVQGALEKLGIEFTNGDTPQRLAGPSRLRPVLPMPRR